MTTPLLRIFVGYDRRETVAYHVLAHSIIRRATIPVSITPLARHQLERLYTRPRGPMESTDFSMSRFIVPALCNYEGWAVFMDCDMLCRVDLAELLTLMTIAFQPTRQNEHGDKAVLVCQHDYQPSETVKFLGNVQTAYPRKNWSSMMAFNNAKCKALTPEYVNLATGLELHRFNWIRDEEIGALPLVWNWLSGEYAPSHRAKILHYTLGGPWFPETAECPQADEWRDEYLDMLGHRDAAIESVAPSLTVAAV